MFFRFCFFSVNFLFLRKFAATEQENSSLDHYLGLCLGGGLERENKRGGVYVSVVVVVLV